MKARKRFEQTQDKYESELILYKDEQESIKRLLRKELRKYNKSAMSLEEVRAILDKKLGDISISQMIISIRKENQ